MNGTQRRTAIRTNFERQESSHHIIQHSWLEALRPIDRSIDWLIHSPGEFKQQTPQHGALAGKEAAGFVNVRLTWPHACRLLKWRDCLHNPDKNGVTVNGSDKIHPSTKATHHYLFHVCSERRKPVLKHVREELSFNYQYHAMQHRNSAQAIRSI